MVKLDLSMSEWEYLQDIVNDYGSILESGLKDTDTEIRLDAERQEYLRCGILRKFKTVKFNTE